MDSLEDISARLILRNVLRTENTTSPVNGRAMNSRPQTNSSRQSPRMKTGRKSETGTPRVTLQHKLKQRLREGASNLQPHVGEQTEESSQKSTLPLLEEDQGVTPRGLLKCIIQTQAETSMVSNQDMKLMPLHNSSTEEMRPPFTDFKLYNDNLEIQSETDLSNITLELKQPIPKGLSRKRAQPPSISVSAFERQLECLTEKTVEPGAQVDDSSNNSLSLTLNSPSLYMTSKRRQLTRKPTSREPVTEEAFDEAVHIRSQKCPESPALPAGKRRRDSYWQEYTLGMNDVTAPDFILSKTAVYTPSTSQPATTDKDFETNSVRKEFQQETSQTTIKEVDITHADKMVSQTQEEGESVSEAAHLDDLDPVLNIQDDRREPEKQQLDMPTYLASDVDTVSLMPVVDKLQATTVCHDATTLAQAIESEELTENVSEVVQMTKSLLQDEVTEDLQSIDHAAYKDAYSSQHGTMFEVSEQTGGNHSVFTGETERELVQQTPAFVRQRREEPTIIRASLVDKSMSPRPVAVKTRPHQQRRKATDRTKSTILPKAYVMSVFRHFAKTKVSSDVYPVIEEILQKYFGRVTQDLEVYASHAKRKTIEKEDVELLMRRQGFITDCTHVNVLIEKFLPLEYRKLLVPIATSGNKVVPKERY